MENYFWSNFTRINDLLTYDTSLFGSDLDLVQGCSYVMQRIIHKSFWKQNIRYFLMKNFFLSLLFRNVLLIGLKKEESITKTGLRIFDRNFLMQIG